MNTHQKQISKFIILNRITICITCRIPENMEILFVKRQAEINISHFHIKLSYNVVICLIFRLIDTGLCDIFLPLISRGLSKTATANSTNEVQYLITLPCQ